MSRISKPIYFPSTLPKFEYLRPKTLEEALEMLSEHGENVAILAGGTDLIVDLRFRLKRPKYVMDIKGIKELHVLEYREGEGLVIGATTTLNEILRHDIVKKKYYALWEAISNMGDLAIRNRATLVGNICNASPAADSAPPLLVLNAKVELRSVEGSREVPLREFFVGVKKTVRKPNELVTKVHIPEPPKGAKGMYFKAVRTSEDLSLVGIAGLAANIEEPSKRIVRLAYASVAPTPVVIDEVEEVFRKDKPVKELIREAVDVVKKRLSPITDVRATKEYRLHLIEYGTRYLLRLLFRG